MATENAVPKLVGGPYEAPPFKLRSKVRCAIRGRVLIEGETDAPIRWPIATQYPHGMGRSILIVFEGLEKAIRTESVKAVAYHWGVSTDTVRKWRRALKVKRMTPGTRSRMVEMAAENLSEEDRIEGGKVSSRFRERVRKE